MLPNALGVGPLLVVDPGVGFAEQFGRRQCVVVVQAVGFAPGGLAVLEGPLGRERVLGLALGAGVPPEAYC